MSDPAAPTPTLEERVRNVIDGIRPYIQADGGDIDFVSLADTVVKVRLQGACRSCPHAAMTLQMGVERAVKQHVPEVTRVENVT